MNGLQTANAPSAGVVVPHYVFASFAFLILTVLMLVSSSEWINLYFSPKLIAITHMAVLGWASMIAFGALYQLIPVIYETSLYSEKLAMVTFIMFTVSIVALSYSFWIASYSNLLFYSALLMFLSLLLFVINLVLTFRKRQKNNIQAHFISAAVFWLALTEIAGTLIAIDFKYNIMNDVHLHYLKIHAHLGLVGWFLLLIIGASSILIPMFVVSHHADEKRLKLSFYTINTGLAGLTLSWLFHLNDWFSYVFIGLIVVGLIFYFTYVYQVYEKRIRKKPDTGMKFTLLSIILLNLPLLIGLAIVKSDISSLSVNYGFGIIFGFITTIILGQIYKTLPFIIWLERYQTHVGKFKTPLPRELYSETLAKYQLYIYLISYGIAFFGMYFKHEQVLNIGIIGLIITALINLYNILKMTFHKTQLSPLT